MNHPDPRSRRGLRLAALFVVLCPAAASAQLQLHLAYRFLDRRAGGNGNIGVTQDAKTKNFYVLDFSNTQTVHEFDSTGSPLGQFPTSTCNPVSPSPNGITYEPTSDTLWLVDNDGGGTVLQMDRTGKCIGGFKTKPTLNTVGIAFNLLTNTLFVSRNDGVDEYDRTGTPLTGGFAFRPSSGSNILSGITWMLPTNRFLVTQSSGDKIFELDRSGALVSTTSLAAFGIRNTQGIHYDLSTNRLIVVDNTLSTTFVFDFSKQPLTADISEITLSSGGTQVLSLDAGATHGNRSYWIFGSMTGTQPGVVLNGLTIPLNPDLYTDLAIANTNGPILASFRGALSATGTATARLNVPVLPATTATLYHAFIVFDPSRWYLASNPVFVRLR